MAGEGRPPTAFAAVRGIVVGGRAKRGHDTWVNLSAGWDRRLDWRFVMLAKASIQNAKSVQSDL